MATAPLIQIDAEGTGPQMDFWHGPAAFRALSGGIGFVTPAQRHDGEDRAILAHRSRVYEQAKANKPLRWRPRPTRNWEPVEVVYLNPDKPAATRPETVELAA